MLLTVLPSSDIALSSWLAVGARNEVRAVQRAAAEHESGKQGGK